MVAGDLGEEFVGGDTDGGGEAALGVDALFQGARQGEGAEEGGIGVGGLAEGREVEVGFVDACSRMAPVWATIRMIWCDSSR